MPVIQAATLANFVCHMLCEHVKAAPPSSDFDEVLLPGEPEQRSIEQRQARGIPVDEVTWTQLTAAAAKLGIAVPTAN